MHPYCAHPIRIADFRFSRQEIDRSPIQVSACPDTRFQTDRRAARIAHVHARNVTSNKLRSQHGQLVRAFRHRRESRGVGQSRLMKSTRAPSVKEAGKSSDA